MECKRSQLNSLGLLQIYRDALNGIAQAQAVMGVLFLKGYDIFNPDAVCQQLQELIDYEQKSPSFPYATYCLGCLLSQEEDYENAKPHLEVAATKGFVHASALLCMILGKKLEGKQEEQTFQSFLEAYRIRFEDTDLACEDRLIMSQEYRLDTLIQLALTKLPKDEQERVIQERIQLAEKILNRKKSNGEYVSVFLKGKRWTIKEDQNQARTFLKRAAEQEHPIAKKLLESLSPLEPRPSAPKNPARSKPAPRSIKP